MKKITIPMSVRSIELSAEVVKLCPYRMEEDRGSLTVWIEACGKTFELHAFSRRLKRYAQIAISHEDLVDEVLEMVVQELKPTAATVRAEFVTADIVTTVRARYNRRFSTE